MRRASEIRDRLNSIAHCDPLVACSGIRFAIQTGPVGRTAIRHTSTTDCIRTISQFTLRVQPFRTIPFIRFQFVSVSLLLADFKATLVFPPLTKSRLRTSFPPSLYFRPMNCDFPKYSFFPIKNTCRVLFEFC